MSFSTPSILAIASILTLSMYPPVSAVHPFIITTTGDNAAVMNKLRKPYLGQCNVTVVEKMLTRPSQENDTEMVETPVKTYSDPCNHPRLRMFMHCNPIKKSCECYRNWFHRQMTEVYDKPELWKDVTLSEEWFVYSSHAQECLIKTHKKCGTRSEPTPYRCEGNGNCVVPDEDDNLFYVCAGVSIKDKLLSWWRLSLWAVVNLIGASLN